LKYLGEMKLDSSGPTAWGTGSTEGGDLISPKGRPFPWLNPQIAKGGGALGLESLGARERERNVFWSWGGRKKGIRIPCGTHGQ